MCIATFNVSDLGPLAPIFTFASYAVAATSALYFLIRGRRRQWEPSDSEVPLLAEKTAVAASAVVIVISFAVLNDRAHLTLLALFAAAAAILLIAAFISFVSLSQKYLFKAPHLAQGKQHVHQRVVGDAAYLEPAAKAQLSQGTSLQDLIDGCGQNFNLVFQRERRVQLQIRFQIAYFCLVFSFIVVLVFVGEILWVASRNA